VADRLVLIVLIDALGYELAGNRSFLPILERERAPIRSVLGYSSANLPTIMSGRTPSEHRQFSMYRRAGRDGVFQPVGRWLRLAARWTKRRWRISVWLARWLRRRGITGYFSLYEIPLALLPEFDLCQRRDLYAPNAFEHLPGLVDHMAAAGPYRVWNWSVPEEQSFRELKAEIDRGEARTLFLYTSALDGIMHAAGPESGAAAERLALYSEWITEAVEWARRAGREVRAFVFGDHGMAPVRGVHDLHSELAALPVRVPEQCLYFLDSTMARFWFPDPTARRPVEELLARQPYGRILGDDELRRLGAFFPGADYGELIFVLEEGEILVPSFMSSHAVKGMHGYHPDGRHAYTVLATNVHDRPYPRDLLELHALLRDELREAAR
jgi:hypothetical protein